MRVQSHSTMRCVNGSAAFRRLTGMMALLMMSAILSNCGKGLGSLPPPGPSNARIEVSFGGSVIANATGSFSFGVVPVNFNTGLVNLTVSNSGTEALVINNFELSGNDISQFSIVSQPTIVLAGETATLSMFYFPTVSGSKQAELTIRCNADVSTYAFDLTGATEWGSTFVDGGVATGINFDTTRAALVPIPVVFNDKLYVVWQEAFGGNTQIRVALYNGDDSNPSFSFVDGNAVTGINIDVTEPAGSPHAGSVT